MAFAEQYALPFSSLEKQKLALRFVKMQAFNP